MRHQSDVKGRVVIDFPSADKAWEAEKALKALGIKSVRMEMSEQYCHACFAGNHHFHRTDIPCNCTLCDDDA